jgi:hypothetical protein
MASSCSPDGNIVTLDAKPGKKGEGRLFCRNNGSASAGRSLVGQDGASSRPPAAKGSIK